MKIRKNFVRFALAFALVISMMAAMSVGALADEVPVYDEGYSVTVTSSIGGSVVADHSQDIASAITITLTVTPDTGYVLSSLSVKDASGNAVTTTAGAEANTYTFVMPASNVTVSATFEQVAANLDSTTTSQTVAQNYDLTLSGGSYTDVTKVKVEWSTTDISATRTDNKTWNPSTLSWDATTDNNTVTVSKNGGATFTLTNLSSVSVNATVTFAQVSGFSAPTVVYTEDGTEGDGAATIGTVVGDNHSVNTSTDHDTIIGVTVTPVASDFKALSAATDAQYGTYTVTIG